MTYCFLGAILMVSLVANNVQSYRRIAMFTHLGTGLKAGVFYVIAFGLAVVVAAAVALVPGLAESLGQFDLYMLTPLAAVVLMLLVVTRDGFSRAGWQGLGLHRLGVRSWTMAFLAPLGLFAGIYGIVWSVGLGRLDLSTLPALGEILMLLVITTIFGLAEEIGWRGYLLPHLASMGPRRALLLSGLLHGLWHLPVILLTSTYHENGNRLIVVALFLLSLTAAGVFYGYLRLMSESVWPAALAHGAINTLGTVFATITVAVGSPALLEYWAGESGVLSLIAITLLAGWLLYRLEQKPVAAQPVVGGAQQPIA
jgi:membrane protease YdiL (CAAX protease family)